MVKSDAGSGLAYPGVGYANEAVVLYSEIDPVLHNAVAAGRYGQPVPNPLPAGLTAADYPSSTINYAPAYFLVNGEPYSAASPTLAAGNVGEPTLVRFLNAGLKTHVPVLDGQYLRLVAEDGKPYPHAKEQYSVMLPALKTVDAILTPSAVGRFALFDRRLDLTTDAWPDGGMLAFLTVGGGGPAPVALDNAYSLGEDGVLAIAAPGVLGDDTGSAALSANLVSGVSNGTLSLLADGSFSYTPNANYFGIDSFTYTANDGVQDSNAATVSLTVNPVNDRPVGTDDSYRIVTGGVLTVAASGVLANDSDADGDTLTAAVVGTALPGLTLNPDGSFTYDTKVANPLPTTTVKFTYQALDSTSHSTWTTARIRVTDNHAPVAVNDSVSTSMNVALVIPVLGNDYDPDTAADPSNTLDPTSVRVSGFLTIATQQGGTATVDTVSGTITFTPSPDFTGVDSFVYRVRDTLGLRSELATVQVNVM
jgi:hypothetical protein